MTVVDKVACATCGLVHYYRTRVIIEFVLQNFTPVR